MIVIYLLLFSDAKSPPPPVISPLGYKPPKNCLRNKGSYPGFYGIIQYREYILTTRFYQPNSVFSYNRKNLNH